MNDQPGNTVPPILPAITRLNHSPAVTLPAGTAVKRDSLEFQELLQRTLPLAISGTLGRQIRQEQHRDNRLQYLLYALYLLLLVFCLYHFFPNSKPLRVQTVPELQYIDLAGELPADSTYQELYRAAKFDHQRGRFYRAVYLLQKPVQKLIGSPDHANGKLLFIFFDSARRAILPPNLAGFAREAIADAVKWEPDNINWRIFDLQINSKAEQNFEQCYRQIGNDLSTLNLRYLRTKGYLRKVADAKQVLQNNYPNLPGTNFQEYLLQLDLIEAKLQTAMWCLEAKIDPDASPLCGNVPTSKRAWQICGKYPQLRNFLQIREFILTTMLANTDYLTRYYWNGEYLYLEQTLKNELTKIRGELSRTAQQVE